ncbi:MULTISPECIES: phosphate propanoyltransferase [unclassified Bacillus (in: firmicutes)]|uniref:phosphate propanoyltransferase n=1 Tax=unclassified Bacillus (in: firmicutes) TaxID=185979 RepID=UPI0008EEA875|nr:MULTISPECIES: phosphate propanoyltransferase [unclassified Bacillus (in: firmicutes)]SFB07478.1 putative phosphotransacetylase [Bacillus sp. UNCCL13]SFQ87325.1 putative phosphotransacetylase [Bacillus sp. cl95]
MLIPLGVSSRHIHLKREHVDVLFGGGYELTNMKDLSQPGEFAANETVRVVGPKGEFPKVRVLGPMRNFSQLEISLTDSFSIGVKAPLRSSGNIEGTPGIKLIGPNGELELTEGVIVAERHIHMTPSDAEKFGVKNGEYVSVKTSGPRGLIFDNVLIRVKESFALDMHIDTDEANAAGVKTGDKAEILSEK